MSYKNMSKELREILKITREWQSEENRHANLVRTASHLRLVDESIAKNTKSDVLVDILQDADVHSKFGFDCGWVLFKIYGHDDPERKALISELRRIKNSTEKARREGKENPADIDELLEYYGISSYSTSEATLWPRFDLPVQSVTINGRYLRSLADSLDKVYLDEHFD